MIIDRVAERITNHQCAFDKDGNMAAGEGFMTAF